MPRRVSRTTASGNALPSRPLAAGISGPRSGRVRKLATVGYAPFRTLDQIARMLVVNQEMPLSRSARKNQELNLPRPCRDKDGCIHRLHHGVVRRGRQEHDPVFRCGGWRHEHACVCLTSRQVSVSGQDKGWLREGDGERAAEVLDVTSRWRTEVIGHVGRAKPEVKLRVQRQSARKQSPVGSERCVRKRGTELVDIVRRVKDYRGKKPPIREEARRSATRFGIAPDEVKGYLGPKPAWGREVDAYVTGTAIRYGLRAKVDQRVVVIYEGHGAERLLCAAEGRNEYNADEQFMEVAHGFTCAPLAERCDSPDDDGDAAGFDRFRHLPA